MPIYPYECEVCSHTFEQYQSMTADALIKCPECGKDELFRVITGGVAARVVKTIDDFKAASAELATQQGHKHQEGNLRINKRGQMVRK